MAELTLEIITPNRVYFKDEIKSFTAPGTEGSFQILPRHAPFVSTLEPGRVKIVHKDGQTRYYAVSGGTVEVHEGHITLLAEAFESIDEIDIERARQAKERAERRIKSKEPGMDIERAKLSLLRAINRIRVAGE